MTRLCCETTTRFALAQNYNLIFCWMELVYPANRHGRPYCVGLLKSLLRSKCRQTSIEPQNFIRNNFLFLFFPGFELKKSFEHRSKRNCFCFQSCDSRLDYMRTDVNVMLLRKSTTVLESSNSNKTHIGRSLTFKFVCTVFEKRTDSEEVIVHI